MADDTDDGTPGETDWARAARLGPWLVLPSLTMRKVRAETDRVLAARTVWLSFVVLHVLLGVVVGVILLAVGLDGTLPITVAAGSVALFGVGAIWARQRTASRSLDTTDGATVASTWYARFLRQCAITSVVLPWAAVAAFYAGAPWVYGVGLVLAAIALALLAPTDQRLADEAAAAHDQDPGVDLLPILRSGGSEGFGSRRGKGRR